MIQICVSCQLKRPDVLRWQKWHPKDKCNQGCSLPSQSHSCYTPLTAPFMFPQSSSWVASSLRSQSSRQTCVSVASYQTQHTTPAKPGGEANQEQTHRRAPTDLWDPCYQMKIVPFIVSTDELDFSHRKAMKYIWRQIHDQQKFFIVI